jgi:hypothetical protein
VISEEAAMTRPRQRIRPARTGRSARRDGLQTLELVLVLPILMLVSIALFQFAVLMLVEQAVTHAATAGAREAGKGADADELVDVVEAILAPHAIKIGPHASLTLEDPTASPPIDQRGSLACPPPSTPLLDSDEVRVTVCLDLTSKPLLNALKSYGIDLMGKRFRISSVVKKEE